MRDASVCRFGEAGSGGTLVGINRPGNPGKILLPLRRCRRRAVTAVLDFKPTVSGSKTPAKRSLSARSDPARNRSDFKQTVRGGDFHTTSLLTHRPSGLMEAIRVDRYYRTAGLTMLQPYDPSAFQLFSFMDSSRNRECGGHNRRCRVRSGAAWAFPILGFGYPTGDPISISALQFRESLAGVYRLYPRTKDMVLISHSLGGLLSKMQTISTQRAAWDGVFGSDADRLYAKVPPDNLKQALIFDANPRVKRVVFICVPHRGSPLADNSIGAIGLSLIHLPAHRLIISSPRSATR